VYREYASLRWFALQPAESVLVAKISPQARVTLDSPAVSVMTDFSQIPAATVDPEASIETANDFMKRRGVRALLVTDPGVIGILTATDVLGEKPVKLALDRGARRDEIRVADIMTPRELIELLSFSEIRDARVGHIVATLKQAGRQHLLVGERTWSGVLVRGMFSLSQVARQLGVDLQPTTFAHTFAEIEAALGH
jgi:CBS domain containing-hemolysin-like protein